MSEPITRHMIHEDRRVTQAQQRSDPKDRMTLLLAYLTSDLCNCGRYDHNYCHIRAARLMQKAWSEINGKAPSPQPKPPSTESGT